MHGGYGFGGKESGGGNLTPLPIHRRIWNCIRLFGNRRHRPYPFPLCNSGPGGTGNSLLRNNPCGLFYGEIPCARNLTPEEIEEGYEKIQEKALSKYLRAKIPCMFRGAVQEPRAFRLGKKCCPGGLQCGCDGRGRQNEYDDRITKPGHGLPYAAVYAG